MVSAMNKSEGLDGFREAVRELTAGLHGEVVQPEDEEYEAARGVWNGSVDRYPALVARCADAADVAAAVTFARAWSLEVAVRSGGHSFSGHGTTNGGLVIDLSRMKAISIDAERRIARIEPGLTWGEVAAEAHRFGLALTSGDMASVGVGGLALGGGIGWMARKHGLTIDNLLAVELITAEGQLLRASAEENAELFWGLRGGGGNFGIATAFEFQLHQGGIVVGGAVLYEATDAAEILRAYARYAVAAPDELTTMAVLMPAPPAPFIPADKQGVPAVAIMAVYAGDIEEGLRVVAPLRRLGTPIADLIGPMPYPAMFAITEAGAARGLQHHDCSLFLRELDEEVIQAVVAHTATATAPLWMAQLRVLGGAMGRVPQDATAFAHRDKPFMLTIITSWPDPADAAPHHAWVDGVWRALQPHAAGVYVNFLGDEGEERVRAAYPPATYERLAALKNRYDPTNLFRLNQNIKPAAQAPAQQPERAEKAA